MCLQAGIKMFRYTDLSALACQRRTGECVAWRCSPDPTGTQKTHAPSWESTRGHLELPLAPPCDASAHRACCGEGVGPVGPAGGAKQTERRRFQRAVGQPLKQLQRCKGEMKGTKTFAASHPFCLYTGMSSIAFRGNRRSSLRTCSFQETSLFL